MLDMGLMGGGGSIIDKISGLKTMLPNFAKLTQTYLEEGEDEIIFLGTFEEDENGKIIPMARMVACKELEVEENGKKVAKMVITRIVLDENKQPRQWNLLDFLSLLNGNEEK